MVKGIKNFGKKVVYSVAGVGAMAVPAFADTGVSLTVPDVDTGSLASAGMAVLGLIALTAGVAIVINVFKKSKSA